MFRGLTFFRQVYSHFRASLCLNQAAALSFDSLLALAPCLLLAFNILAYWPVAPDAVLQAKAWLLQHLVVTSATVVSQALSRFMHHAETLSWVTWLGLIFSAALLVSNLQESLARIWQKPIMHLSRWMIFLYGFLLLLFPVFLTYTLLLASYFPQVPWVSSVLPSLLVMIFLYMTYRLLPGIWVPHRVTVLSTACVSIIIHILKVALLYYFSLFQSTYQTIYGTLAVFPLFLIWLYLVWVAILFGSVLSYVMAK